MKNVFLCFSTHICFRCGQIPYDLILQRYLRKYILKKVYTDKFYDRLESVEYARNDYLRDSMNDYDMWLLNKEWLVTPTIRLTNKQGPVILTCRSRHNGRKKMMIHPPRLPKHILPSKHADQLVHAVIVGNIVEDEKMVSFDVGQKLSYADVVQNKSDKNSRDEKRDEETIGRPQGLQFVSNPI